MNEPSNQFSVSGPARVTVGALAIGPRARAVNEVVHQRLAQPDQAEVAARLADLVEQLRAHAGELPGSAELLGSTEAVAEELAKDTPSRFTVNALLRALAADTRSVAGVAAAVTAVAEAANALLA